MKGSGPSLSKIKSSKTKKDTNVLISMPPPIQEVPSVLPQPAENFEKFLELPADLQSTILSKGLATSGLRPSQQLQLAATTIPSIVRSVDFLLPKKVITQSIEGYALKSEEKQFQTAIEIKEYVNDLIQNIDTKRFDTLILQNDYIEVRIQYYNRSTDGRITIAVFAPGTTMHMASITFNFVRVKKQYDTIMLSKINLQLYLYKNADLEYLKELFIGARWLFLIFKKITWDKNTVMFENPTNISIDVDNKSVTLNEVNEEVVQKALLLLRYMEQTLKPKRKTTRNTKR